MTNTDLIRAFLAAHPGGARYWPTPDGPDFERRDDEPAEYPEGLDYHWPAPNKESAA
jgi:hypothetical protein